LKSESFAAWRKKVRIKFSTAEDFLDAFTLDLSANKSWFSKLMRFEFACRLSKNLRDLI
jgi:hypothetical protein